MIYHDLLIIGGGASGLMAAIVAKDFGIDVAIIEGTDRIGKKILATGNGRCNISNDNINYPYINFHSENNNFFESVLNSFTVEDTKSFFLSLGLPISELDNGKLYPKSLQASSVVDIFRMALDDKQIPLYTNCKVTSINKNKKFSLSTNNEEYPNFTCNKLILSCGGKSAVKTGSDGTGYKLSKSLGHSIISPLPGIVQLKLDYPYLRALSGIKFDGSATILINDEIVRTEIGEILFTDYGISGPPIMQLSSYASKALSNGSKITIRLDMFPHENKEDIENFFATHFSIFNYREISSSLIGVINKKLISTILKDVGIKDIHLPCNNIDWKYLNKLIDRFKRWDFNCVDTNGFSNAQVTIGGINTSEVNKLTLESKIVNNLYFCGEMLDVHGDCGGFNLQWAWSSGYLAAKSAASK
ncbi:NAD(P)/FAD-dependent oxidoreductase [Clostridium saccharobutylicum]|uniref:HI0933 family protein n=1 Tax=Clostridium saccharobutylicum DSM 13864 TaxID=1345695 RepID=U5N0L1_CLOSA|nr:NAD(P)/FAD-dependent oxidoreductase [Clostridium saccharobutylicum]AGX45446.1 HI0933 family protein [Clostridium saccharobutylicum DSM 13864]AQR92718.1 putative succinate dehydrogenase [Clostridium saccharobutylicum]AQS02620.1 putative succinate dehydrogenase [Clostridium saccharobutylicum]AQS12226.1 putative succinate dehydrogenase [Clostridium saccharobutylicum]AQS16603.1 putative succinate dehydrogenase [Clostridium saccharobutylicum]